jgi:hypothetical protein
MSQSFDYILEIILNLLGGFLKQICTINLENNFLIFSFA